jgi:FkbM family methyltransferase
LNADHRVRAVGRLLRFMVVSRGLHRPMSVPLGAHSSILVHGHETNAPKAVYHNPPNWPEMLVWQQRLRPGDLFVDVGGNIGIYTILAQDLGAATITFEPDRRNCSRILENLGRNGYFGEVHNKAVSNSQGTVRFSQGLDSFNHLVLGDGPGVDVATVTLDSVLGDRRVAGLKIDVEGAERLVLEGAQRALSEHRIALIQCEWSEHEVHRTLGETRQPVTDLLRRHGYLLHRLDEQGRPHLLEGEVAFAALQRLDAVVAPRPRAGSPSTAGVRT